MLILSGVVAGCGDGTQGTDDDLAATYREIDYYCAALFLTRSPQQEARVIKDMIRAAWRRGIVLDCVLQDRKTEQLFRADRYGVIEQPILVFFEFVRPDPARSSLTILRVVKFPPRSRDNVALLIPAQGGAG